MSADADRIIGLYRRHANVWADRRAARFPERRWLERFVRLLPEGAAVLDLGCGSGMPIGHYLVDSGCVLTGVDASPELIGIAQASLPDADLITADMRDLDLGRRFDGILAWNSSFHLTPEDQRAMFPVFARHAAEGAVLTFTSGPRAGVAMGRFEEEALYHASLASDDYRELLETHGFEVLDHVAEDPENGGLTIWLARYRQAPEAP